MKTVSFIGAGLMGTGLASILLKAGVKVRVWDINPDATKTLASRGAVVEKSFIDAVNNSELIISIVNSADIGASMFEKHKDELNLEGKYIANLSTAMPSDGERFKSIVSEKRGTFVNAAISSYPDLIGTDYTAIQYACEPEIWDEIKDTVQPLAPSGTIHTGVRLDVPAIVDAAMTGSFYAVGLAGFLEAAAYANSQGVEPDELEEFADKMIDLLRYKVKKCIKEIKSDDYSTVQATVDVYLDAVIQWRDGLKEMNLHADFISALTDTLQRSKDAGHGDLGFTSQYLVSSTN